MRKRFLIIGSILAIILAFSIYSTNKSDTNKNYVQLVDNKELVIDNMLPLRDEVGSNYSRNNGNSNIYYKIKLKSNHNKRTHYKILLNTEKGNAFIDDRYIKIYLCDKDDNVLKEYDTDSVKLVTGLEQFEGKYVVHSGSLKKNGEEEFILRIWVADSAVYDDELIFDGKLSVYSY